MITGVAASGGATAPPGRESFLLFALFLLRLELLFALAFLLRERQVQLVAEECCNERKARIIKYLYFLFDYYELI